MDGDGTGVAGIRISPHMLEKLGRGIDAFTVPHQKIQQVKLLRLKPDGLLLLRHQTSLTRESEATELDQVTCRPICLVHFLKEQLPSPEHRLDPRDQFAH